MTQPRSGARDPALPALLLLSLALRAGISLAHPDLSGRGDEPLHYVLGVLAAHLGPDVIGRWAPGYELFLAGLVRAFGPELGGLRLAQALVSTLTVGCVYGLAHRAGGRRAARIAGLLAALHPSGIAYSQYLYSETLFVALLLGGLLAFHRTPGGPGRAGALLAGALFGLAALTRSVVVYFLPAWIAWALLRRRRDEARAGALALAAALAVIAPWTARNVLHHGAFLLVDPTLGRTAYLAFNTTRFNRDLGYLDAPPSAPERVRCPAPRAAGRTPLPDARQLLPLFPPEARAFTRSAGGLRVQVELARAEAAIDFAAVQRCEVGRALDFALRRPGDVLRSALDRLYAFWGPNSFLLRYVHQGAYGDGPLSRATYPLWKAVVIAFHVLVFGAAALALAARRPPPPLRWIALFAVYYTAVHALAVAYSRYRLPLEPLACVAAAVFLADPRLPRPRARRLVALAALAGFLVLCGAYAATVLP